MKTRLGKRLVTLAVCCACAGGVALAANTVNKTITVQYCDIKLVVDGVPISPKSANGTAVEPFIYNGTTYLPVRAVGDAVGKQVSWDGQSKTVYLGDAPNSKKWLLDVCPPYESYRMKLSAVTIKMDGKTYTHGFYGQSSLAYALFNLDSKYQTLSCDIGHIQGYSGYDRQVEIYLDGDLSQVIEIPKEAMVKHFDIPLHGALQMKIVGANDCGVVNCVLE